MHAQTLEAFSVEPSGFPTSAAAAANGDLIVGGQFSVISSTSRGRIARLTAAGSVAAGFASGVTSGSQVMAILIHPDGSVTAGGSFTQAGGQAHANLARFDAAGAVDHTFMTQTDGRVAALALQGDGKVLVGGAFSAIGGAGHSHLARLNTDGTVDNGFNASVNDEVLAVLVQADGSIVIAGRFTQVNGSTRNRLARLTAAGDLDTTFDPDADDIVTGLVRQPDGKFLALGDFGMLMGAAQRHCVRFNSDGSLDATFTPPANTLIASAAVQSDGKILISGIFSDPAISGIAIVRLNDDGTLDTDFDAVRSNSPGYIVLDPSGDLYVAGGFTTFMSESRQYLARVTNPTEATRSLTIGATGDITWTLGGSAPVPSFVQVDTSVDGETWTTLGNAVLSGSAWSLTGVSLPAGTMHVRAHGTAPANGSDSSVIESYAVVSTTVGGPSISASPQDQSVDAGRDLTLTVTASGEGTLTYQWRRDGVDISGATESTLTIPAVQAWQAGTYTVLVSNAVGNVESLGAHVTVAETASPQARLLNLSTRALVGTDANVMIPGFVISGTGTKRMLIRAVGPTLSQDPYGLEGVVPDPQMVLKRWNAATPPNGAFEDVVANNDYGDNANAGDITSTAMTLGAFALNDAKESALLVDLEPGLYTVVASGAGNTTGLGIVELYDADQGSPTANMVNMSNRGFAGVGDEVMIPGFVISPEGPKTLLLRVVGPTLESDYGVTGVMADPKLTLYRTESGSQTKIAEQDNWGDSPDAERTAQVATEVGAFALGDGSADAAMVVTLQPGVYSAIGSSAQTDGTGVVLVELYVVP